MGKHRWKGELAKPIRPNVKRPLELSRIPKSNRRRAAINKEMLKLYKQAIHKEWLKKLDLLMGEMKDKYRFADKSDYRSLSLALAFELDIPGFRVDVGYFNSKATPFRLEPVRLAGPNTEPLDKEFLDATVPSIDKDYVRVDPGSYILPADVVAALSQNNRIAGTDILEGWRVVQDNREGRRREWPEKRLRDLLRDVGEYKRKNEGSKDIDALRSLARRPEWSSPPRYEGTLEQWIKRLQNYLSVARRLSK